MIQSMQYFFGFSKPEINTFTELYFFGYAWHAKREEFGIPLSMIQSMILHIVLSDKIPSFIPCQQKYSYYFVYIFTL